MSRTFSLCAFILVSSMGHAFAQCSSYPYSLTNGTTANATEVMANFNCAAKTSGSTLTNTTLSGTTTLPSSGVITSGGSVGIGLTSPNSALDVRPTSGITVSGTGSPDFRIITNVKSITTSPNVYSYSALPELSNVRYASIRMSVTTGVQGNPWAPTKSWDIFCNTGGCSSTVLESGGGWNGSFTQAFAISFSGSPTTGGATVNLGCNGDCDAYYHIWGVILR